MDTSSVKTLKEIAQGILFEYKIPKTEYKRVFQFIIKAYRDLNMYHASIGERWVELTVDATLNSVTLPEDFVSLIKIGIPRNGRLEVFGRDNRIPITTIESGGDEVFDTSFGVGEQINDGEKTGFGAGGKRNYYYTLDERNNRIILNGYNSDKVILYYTSSGTSTTETTYVPVRYVEPIENYVLWKMNFADDKKAMNRAMMYKQEYELAVDKVRALEAPKAIDILHRFMEHAYPTIKR